MANNVVETQIIRDDDSYCSIKVTGVATAAWNVNAGAILLQANSLYGANASQSFCPLSLTDIKFSMDVGALGYIQFYWVTANSSQSNSTIMSFGQIGSATFDGVSIWNSANTPTGDVGVFVSNLQAGNSFNFILTFAKDKQPVLANVGGQVYPGNPAGWANTDSWF